jgi:hypothetical protein
MIKLMTPDKFAGKFLRAKKEEEDRKNKLLRNILEAIQSNLNQGTLYTEYKRDISFTPNEVMFLSSELTKQNWGSNILHYIDGLLVITLFNTKKGIEPPSTI